MSYTRLLSSAHKNGRFANTFAVQWLYHIVYETCW